MSKDGQGLAVTGMLETRWGGWEHMVCMYVCMNIYFSVEDYMFILTCWYYLFEHRKYISNTSYHTKEINSRNACRLDWARLVQIGMEQIWRAAVAVGFERHGQLWLRLKYYPCLHVRRSTVEESRDFMRSSVIHEFRRLILLMNSGYSFQYIEYPEFITQKLQVSSIKRKVLSEIRTRDPWLVSRRHYHHAMRTSWTPIFYLYRISLNNVRGH